MKQEKHAEHLLHIFSASVGTADFTASSFHFLIQSFISFTELGIVGMKKSCTPEDVLEA